MNIIKRLFSRYNKVSFVKEALAEYNLEKIEKKKLDYFLNASNDSILFVSDNKIIQSNNKAREMFLISSFEETCLQEIFSNENDECINEINNISIGKKKEIECKLKRHTGLGFMARIVVSSNLVKDEIIKVITIQDQTDIKRTENFYSILVETMGVGLIITDSRHNITYINSFIIKLTGLNEGNLLGRSVWDFINDDDILTLKNKKVIKGNYSPDEFRIKLNLLDKILYLKINIKPIFENEIFNGNFIVITDETSIVENNNKLKESEKKYRDLINFIPETVIILSQNGEIKLCNIVGTSSLDLCLSKHIIDYLDKKYHSDIINLLDKNKRFSIGLEFNVKNSKVPVLMSGFLTDNSEWVVTITDLTGFINSQDEIIRLETELNKAKKKLGELVVEFNLSTYQEIESLIEKQKDKPKKTGEIAVELGLITDKDLRLVLDIQESRKIGSILVNEKKITPEERDLILDYQSGKISKKETIERINERRNTVN